MIARVFKGLSFIAMALSLGGAMQPAHAAGPADYFKGKTVTYIVATTPGGGYDFYARCPSSKPRFQFSGDSVMPLAAHSDDANLPVGGLR